MPDRKQNSAQKLKDCGFSQKNSQPAAQQQRKPEKKVESSKEEKRKASKHDVKPPKLKKDHLGSRY